MNLREQRGKTLIEKGIKPSSITDGAFYFPSSDGARKYRVIQNFDGWVCNCPDFHYRHKYGVNCKHIHALHYWQELKKYLNKEAEFAGTEQAIQSCFYCNSQNVIKRGIRKNKGVKRQRFFCNDCKHYFIAEKEFERLKVDSQCATLCLDLFFKNMSLRSIQNTLEQFYGKKVSHETVRRYIRTFVKKINDYITTLKPELSGIVCTDEQFLKTPKGIAYAWNSIDRNTKFVLASTIRENRGVLDARAHFQEVKKQTGNERPNEIRTDNLNIYPRAINKEFRTMRKETVHLPVEGLKARINNNSVERYHNGFRAFEKARRSFKEVNAIQDYANGFKIQHNFIHKNSGLNSTPAEKAGLNLHLEGNKWSELIKKSNQS
jgi:transposase-like protein